jgi:hypothetical protein
MGLVSLDLIILAGRSATIGRELTKDLGVW